MSHVLFTYFVVLDITLLNLTVKDTAYNVICQKRNLNLNVIKYYSKKHTIVTNKKSDLVHIYHIYPNIR